MLSSAELNMAEQDLLALVKRLETVAIRLEKASAPGGAGECFFFLKKNSGAVCSV